MLHDIGNLARLEADVDGQGDDASLKTGEQQQRGVRRIGPMHADAVTGRDAVRQERAGQAPGTFVHLRIGEAVVSHRQGDLVGMARGKRF